MKMFIIAVVLMISIKPVTAEAKAALESTAFDLLCCGEGGAGKTHVGAEKAIIIGSIYKNNVVNLIRKTKVTLRLTLWNKFKELIPNEWIVQRDENRMYYKIKNGTEFYGLGLDTPGDVNRLASFECGFQVVEEMPEITDETVYDEKIKRACRLPRVPFHQTMALCNPGAPSHWIYKKWFLEPGKGFENIAFKTLPRELGIMPASFYDWLDSLTGVYRQRYKEGKWIAFEGLVYPFDPRKNIIEAFYLPKTWKRVLAVDFGFAHPFVAQWWAVSPSEMWYMYREIYMTQRIVSEHAKEIKKFCLEDEMDAIAICDHDAEDRATLEAGKIATLPAKKERLAGQQIVYEKFEHETKKEISPNKIFFFKDALVEKDMSLVLRKKPICTVQEFGTYIWKDKGKEDMVKQLDDGMDTMRYAMTSEQGALLRWL